MSTKYSNTHICIPITVIVPRAYVYLGHVVGEMERCHVLFYFLEIRASKSSPA